LSGTLAIAGYAAGAVLAGVGVGLVVGAPAGESGAASAVVRCGPFADVGVSCQGRF
jgi:hypothetical protein